VEADETNPYAYCIEYSVCATSYSLDRMMRKSIFKDSRARGSRKRRRRERESDELMNLFWRDDNLIKSKRRGESQRDERRDGH